MKVERINRSGTYGEKGECGERTQAEHNSPELTDRQAALLNCAIEVVKLSEKMNVKSEAILLRALNNFAK